MTFGSRIANYRKNMGITQDALAQQLEVTNQAVSKWESDQCCPDIQLLPKLADIFGVTIDELFGRERKSAENITVHDLPWADDGNLRGVLYVGRKLVSHMASGNDNQLQFSESIKNIACDFSVVCGSVHGNVDAAGDVRCGSVEGDIDAGGSVKCGNVGGDIDCGGQVRCGDVGGDVDCGGNVTCGSIDGGVDAGGTVNCTDVGGDVDAGGDVMCGDVGGSVDAGTNVTCGNVGGTVDAGGDVNCCDVSGDVDAGGKIILST